MNVTIAFREQNIPSALRDRRQWVLWRIVQKPNDKPTKIPFQPDGTTAASTDPMTWCSFAEAISANRSGKFSGIGFVFAANDELFGVDLDGCRDPQTGQIAEWARETILSMGTYAELSPSFCGVKLFGIGKSPFERGRKVELTGVPKLADKTPAIEVYDWGRYFAVTGLRLASVPIEPTPSQVALESLCADPKYFPPEKRRDPGRSQIAPHVIDRARKYIAKMEPAISGQGGHDRCYAVACKLAIEFGLDRQACELLMNEYNERCEPPWSERELAHKIDSAMNAPGQRGFLLNSNIDRPPSPIPSSGCVAIDLANKHAIDHRRRAMRRERSAFA